MAKLSKIEWSAIRERWECDPRIGYTWIVIEWKLPVTHVAVYQRSQKEGWTKRLSLKAIVELAHLKADLRMIETQASLLQKNKSN